MNLKISNLRMSAPRILCLLIISVILGGLALGNNALAQIENPLGGADTIAEVLQRIASFLLTIAAPILVIMVLSAGFMYLTSAGVPEKIKQANRALLWAVIGFAVILINWGFAYIIREILGGGARPPGT